MIHIFELHYRNKFHLDNSTWESKLFHSSKKKIKKNQIKVSTVYPGAHDEQLVALLQAVHPKGHVTH